MPALGWMVKAYKELGELDHPRGLTHIGYNRCWDDNQFIVDALGRGAEFLKEVLPKGFADSVENVFDDDDLPLMRGYLDLESALRAGIPTVARNRTLVSYLPLFGHASASPDKGQDRNLVFIVLLFVGRPMSGDATFGFFFVLHGRKRDRF